MGITRRTVTDTLTVLDTTRKDYPFSKSERDVAFVFGPVACVITYVAFTELRVGIRPNPSDSHYYPSGGRIGPP
jgi:hypothetical protein